MHAAKTHFLVFQVVDDCGRLALTVGLAAPLLKGPPQDPTSWRDLHNALARKIGDNDCTKSVETRTTAVLEVSFSAMADDPRKQERCTFLAILAPGVIVPLDMLEHLWDEVRGGGQSDGCIIHTRNVSLMSPQRAEERNNAT